MHRDLTSLDLELKAALSGLDSAQTQARPSAHPEKWSIQQIAEHLIQTYRTSVPAMQSRLDKCRPTLAKPTLGQRLGQFWITRLGRFPGGREAPAAVSPSRPAILASGPELADRIAFELLRVDAVTGLGERLFGQRRAVSHPVLGPLSMQQWRRFHLIHGRHHIAQIRAIRRDHSI